MEREGGCPLHKAIKTENPHLLRYTHPSESSLTHQSTQPPQDSQALHMKNFQADYRLRLGQINFINCLPINYPIAKLDLEAYSFVDASPAELNQALREGSVDIAPISSYEYLSNKDLYDLIPGISISSKIQADSVLFFYQGKLEEHKEIFITDKSATSVNLLKLILVRSCGLKLEDIKFTKISKDSNDYKTKLLIGDEALKAKKDSYTVLDLGEEWFKLTKLPMVFGLWTASRKSEFSEDELAKFSAFFCEMRNQGLDQDLPDIIIEAFRRTGLPKTTLTQYFKNLDYNFTDEHKESLELFEDYLLEEGLLSS